MQRRLKLKYFVRGSQVGVSQALNPYLEVTIESKILLYILLNKIFFNQL